MDLTLKAPRMCPPTNFSVHWTHDKQIAKKLIYLNIFSRLWAFFMNLESLKWRSFGHFWNIWYIKISYSLLLTLSLFPYYMMRYDIIIPIFMVYKSNNNLIKAAKLLLHILLRLHLKWRTFSKQHDRWMRRRTFYVYLVTA